MVKKYHVTQAPTAHWKAVTRKVRSRYTSRGQRTINSYLERVMIHRLNDAGRTRNEAMSRQEIKTLRKELWGGLFDEEDLHVIPWHTRFNGRVTIFESTEAIESTV